MSENGELVPWQAARDAGWTRVKVKYAFEVVLGKMLQNGALSAEDIEVPYLKSQHVQDGHIRTDDLPTMWASPRDVEALRVKPGDLLVCEGGDVGRSAVVGAALQEDTIIQNALHRVRSGAGNEPRFLKHLLDHARSSGWFDIICNRSTIAHFTVEKFDNLWAWLPPPDEQRAIAADLDRETARLDALVDAKKRLLRRIADKRQALVSRAVTRGLDPAAPRRDSGVPWLGDVPAHWGVRRVANLFEEVDERGEPGLPLLVVSINTGVSLREFSDDRIERVAADFESYKVVRAGEFAFNKMRMWQGAVGVAPEDGLISPDYVVARPIVQLDAAYFEYLLRLPMMSAEFARHSHGIVWDRLRLYWAGFRVVHMPFPPLAEQRVIAAEITRETAALDALAATTRRSVERLGDRRAALIAETVTGRRRVLQPA